MSALQESLQFYFADPPRRAAAIGFDADIDRSELTGGDPIRNSIGSHGQ
nr:hypothetical protein [Anatilimnocola aggregata]